MNCNRCDIFAYTMCKEWTMNSIHFRFIVCKLWPMVAPFKFKFHLHVYLNEWCCFFLVSLISYWCRLRSPKFHSLSHRSTHSGCFDIYHSDCRIPIDGTHNVPLQRKFSNRQIYWVSWISSTGLDIIVPRLAMVRIRNCFE